MDFETQQRTIKRSGEFYQKLIAAHGVSKDLYQEYCDVPYARNTEAEN